MRVLVAVVGVALCASLAGCETVTPQQQHASDQDTCASYGYQPGTDKFADCMMSTAHRREDSKTAQDNQRDRTRLQSIKRNGDTRFPVCTASNMNASLDIDTGKWFGPDCREE